MVVFNGYPTEASCGQQSQNLNNISDNWTENCVNYDNMKFAVIDDDCAYVNIFL